MATTTAADLVNKALQKLGIIASGESATTTQSNDAFDALNIMLDSWGGRGLLTKAVTTQVFPLIANQYSYTIGTGGNFNTVAPLSIENGFIRDTGNSLDYPLAIITRDQWNSYADKLLTGNASRPEALFFDAGATQQSVQTGTINLYPIPDSSTTYNLSIDCEKTFTEFTSLTNNIAFPPAYLKAIIYNLAIDLAPDYGLSVSAEIKIEADEAMRIIENINSRNKRYMSGFSFPNKQKTFNILSGLSD